MTTPQQQIIDKCKAVFAAAQATYGVDLSRVDIRFDLKGRAAGMACRRGAQYYMRFNRDMLTREAFDHVINNTVPHETAHIVCFMKPSLGSGHNSGWARVCESLGGSGDRCHKEEVVYGKGYTYEYHTDRGNKVRVGDKYHAMVQRGQPLRYKKGLGTVNQMCAYSIVGHQGRTLANPIVKRAANHPSVIEQAAVAAKGTTVNVIGVAPVQPRTIASATLAAGASKASISRSIMLAGHGQGKSYEEIIAAMVAACGYDRQLARATYKANYAKVGVPMPA